MFLSGQGFLCWSNNTGAIKSASGRFQRYGLIGSSDILSVHPQSGVLYCFEVKSGRAVQNKHQRSFEKAIKKRNAYYYIIRSVEDLNEKINT